jgi:hypothetical protein
LAFFIGAATTEDVDLNRLDVEQVDEVVEWSARSRHLSMLAEKRTDETRASRLVSIRNDAAA